MKLSELKVKTPAELLDLAQSLGIENISRAKKQTLIFAILKNKADNEEEVLGDGVLDILQEGYGFLRSSNDSYVSGPDDIYVSPNQIRRFNLSTGDVVTGKIRAPKKGEKYFALIKVSEVNGDSPENIRNRIPFSSLTPLHPNEELGLELGNGGTEDITARVIDLVAPFGKGQRGLLVAPPKAGKTMIMQNIASSIAVKPS
jgi:transcription termination factor Rho